MGNPRLPPYPHPITIYPAFQVKQPLNVVLNPGNKNQSPSHSPTGFDNVYCVCAKFCTPRLCVVGSPKLDMERRGESVNHMKIYVVVLYFKIIKVPNMCTLCFHV